MSGPISEHDSRIGRPWICYTCNRTGDAIVWASSDSYDVRAAAEASHALVTPECTGRVLMRNEQSNAQTTQEP